MTTRKLSAMPYAQAHIEITEDFILLFSYRTLVAALHRDGWLSINGLYSMTTRKHIGAFMREYCNADYQLAKRMVEDNFNYNVLTGEVVYNQYTPSFFYSQHFESRILFQSVGMVNTFTH